MGWLARRRRDRAIAELRREAYPVDCVLAWWAGDSPGFEATTCTGIVLAHTHANAAGLGAWVDWLGGLTDAVWFDAAWPPVGSLIVATGRLDWGPEHPVFHVPPGGTSLIPDRAVTAWEALHGPLAVTPAPLTAQALPHPPDPNDTPEAS